MISEERLLFNLQYKTRMLGYSEQSLENPVTIQDKLRWLNIYDADPLKSDCADKLKVKDYAKKITGVDLGVQTIAVWDKAEDIDFDKLPDKFVLKCNHGSGMNIIVKDKSQLDRKDALNRLQDWMNDDFAFRNGFESHYHWIERKIFAEEYISIPESQDVPDYKFICMNGEPVYLQIISERFSAGRRMRYYDMNLKRLDISRRDFSTGGDADDIMPQQFDLMKQYAKQLSKDFKFVRVDFYEANGRIYLGEMTFTPGAFIFRYGRPEDEITVGNLLSLLNKQFVIVNYNTPQFVEKLIMSINKFVNDAHITIFDNSDKSPFINTFNNVKVIDNTKGQIVNFNEFLNRYPKRYKTSAKANNWASAKHCYTILKCIEMMDSNFILLDSDVLLKHDVSDLFDNNYIYISEVLTQGNKRKRVAPFLCFINVQMCKQNNIKYFDEHYMHGLSNGTCDMYDTGGAFYINSQNYNHKEIKVDDYAIHYGHGSWTSNGYTYLFTPDEFFEKYKDCWKI